MRVNTHQGTLRVNTKPICLTQAAPNNTMDPRNLIYLSLKINVLMAEEGE